MGERVPPLRTPPSLDGLDVSKSPHAQFLATEHWSLLATRSMTWSEIFSRTGTYLTVLSATVIALSLVANATGFGRDFQMFALLIMPVVLLVGIATYFRLVEADIEDAWLVIGMNRLRHAYLELAPELEPYFIASQYDDAPGLLHTYSFRSRVGLTHWLSGSPVLVGIIDSVVAGVLAAVICDAAGAGMAVRTTVGIAAAVVTAFLLGLMGYRHVRHASRDYRAKFPS
jgi:uncharacterized membrane protein YeaQ/YmgE (transglycosylase-associated protein family)